MAQSQRKPKVLNPASSSVKVKFLEDCDPGHGKSIFKKGAIRELNAASARHWIRRGLAVKYVTPIKKHTPVAKPKPAVKKPVEKPSVITEEKKTEDGDLPEGPTTLTV